MMPLCNLHPSFDPVRTFVQHTEIEDLQLCPLILACDEAYVMPLATVLLSIAESHRPHWPLLVVVVNDGISEKLRHLVLQSLPKGALTLQWVDIDLAAFRSFSLLPHVSTMTYARLLLPQLLPATFGRVLYLDTDTLVMGDLTPLMRVDLKGLPLAAIEDSIVRADRAAGQLDPLSPPATLKQYFNAGVLLLDLQVCRESLHFVRAMQYLRAHPRTPFGDQDALNVALEGLWLSLDRHWNFQNHHVTRLDCLTKDARPAIAHFVTSSKPWIPACTSLNAGLYNKIRDRTQFGRSRGRQAGEWVVRTYCRVGHRIGRLHGWLTGGLLHRSLGSTDRLEIDARERHGD
jgi:lipopolysaccharide biosynthesis glycosyltransferase